MQEEYLDQSIQLASIIQHGFTDTLKRKDRGVKQAGFVVLHQTYMPSVLIETGFLTNKSESTYLNSTIGQQKFSESIYKGIVKYFNQLSLNSVTTNNTIVEKPKAPTKEIISNNKDIQFKVQIAAGKRKLATKAYNFKGLRNVERVKVGNIYRYYLGNTLDYSEILELQKFARSKGHSTAFVVAFKNGKKIDIKDVLKKS